MGTDAIDGGIDVADLEDGAFARMTLAGEELYCGVTKVGDTYYCLLYTSVVRTLRVMARCAWACEATSWASAT